MIIAPTTTTQLHYYDLGEPRAEHLYVRFCPNDGFGFISECILDLAEADIVGVIVKSGVWGFKRRPCLVDLLPVHRL